MTHRFLAPRKDFEAVFRELARLRASAVRTDDADLHAWALVLAGLERFGGEAEIDGAPTTDDARQRAYRALRGRSTKTQSISRRTAELALRHIDATLMGDGPPPSTICTNFGRPATDAPELQRMLENVVTAKKSGRLPSGKFTRRMIAEWLTGHKWGRAIAAKLEKERR